VYAKATAATPTTAAMMARRVSGKVLDDTDDWGIQTSFQSFLFRCSDYIDGGSTRTYIEKVVN
jgi:hypothetical protein